MKNNFDASRYGYCINQALSAAKENWERPALRVQNETWLYKEIFSLAWKQAQTLKQDNKHLNLVIGIYAERHWSAYSGVLTAMLLGVPYVPINPTFPVERNRAVLNRAGVTTLIYPKFSESAVQEIIAPLASEDSSFSSFTCADLKVNGPTSKYSSFDEVGLTAPEIDANDIAYILFTSGSTGEPKGVGISQTNLAAYLASAKQYIDVDNKARFSQNFDLTFDLSVHDMFVCWSNGAELVVPSRDELLRPADYIKHNKITHWFSVPSLGYILRMQNQLGAGNFPDLRSTLFCGEALTREIASEWLLAAPNSKLENWYGPTEATIACTRFEIGGTTNFAESIVPIGSAFPWMTTLVVDSDGCEIKTDEKVGELLLAGPQIAPGYWNNIELTENSFVKVNGYQEMFYRTGDLVYYLAGNLHYVSRRDNQVKIRGYRVELSEIENATRHILAGANVTAFSWPTNEVNGNYIVCAVEGEGVETASLIKALRLQLPIYMVPSAIFEFSLFPKNSNGKIDRREIVEELHRRFSAQRKEQSLSKDKMEHQLQESIYQIKPGLSEKQIYNAENLLDAGMDSLDFVALTLVLEEKFGVNLDQEKVAQLSTLTFKELILAVRNNGEIPAIPERHKDRANRAIEFVQKFPGITSSADTSLLLAVGSSGIVRGFNAEHFHQLSIQNKEEIRTLNIGLPALNCRGITRICKYIRDTSIANNCRPNIIIYELDPMLISTLPPKGDIELPESVFNGTNELANPDLAADFKWSPESYGDVEFSEKSVNRARRARWEKERDFEIADTYAGRIDFDKNAFLDWLEGLSVLGEITDQLICFIHPMNHDDTFKIESIADNKFSRVLEQIQQKNVSMILEPKYFSVPESDYLNINHVTPTGSINLTKQIFKLINTNK